MSSLFGGAAGPTKAQKKAQRRQNKQVEDQLSTEAREAGSRKRALEAGRKGGSLFSSAGARGVRDTLG